MKSDSSNANKQGGRRACEKVAPGNGRAISRRDFVRTAGSALAVSVGPGVGLVAGSVLATGRPAWPSMILTSRRRISVFR